MPLNKDQLITDLTSVFSNLEGKTAAVKAGEIADAIDKYIKTATVTTTVSVASVSAVTPGAGVSGPGTGTGTGTLS